MAAQNNKAARYSIKLIKNAGVVSNFCNDVIGDICGIISGAAGAIIVFKITNFYDIKELTTLSVVMSGFIASLTVGGKAIGKEIAINYSKNIMYYTGKVVMFFDNKLNLKILDK
jgi:CBS domain containing-hemolysin-like protein